MTQINTRADLDALKGTPAYAAALELLEGSMTTMVDVAAYPVGYGQPGYAGVAVVANRQPRESLQSISLLGFTKAEFLAECTMAGV